VHVSRAVLLLAALLATGCADPAAGSSDVLGDWYLAEGTADGVPLPQLTEPATLTIGPDELSGTSFCNHYGSTYRIDGATLAVDGLGGTDMACAHDVMAAESAYLGALGRADTVGHDGADLLLTGDGIRLRFSPVPPAPDRELAGTRWVLDTLVDGEVASSTLGEPAVLLLRPDQTAEASTGCRTVTGTWLVEDGALVIDDLLADGTCPPDVVRQDDHVAAVLAGGPVAEISEDRLTLTGPDGRGLVYRAGA
jgi:heat shock protein HslJ